MTAETAKQNNHRGSTVYQHNHHHPGSDAKLHLQSIERLTTFPVVQSAHNYYEKIKESNVLIKWSLYPYEAGVWFTVQSAMPIVTFFVKPVELVDSIACKGLDVLEANLPIVTYPPELMYSMTKDYVSSKLVTPVLKRADSVKQLSINCREMAATGLNQAIDAADKYVDKYLPDITDTTDNPAEQQNSPTKPATNPDSKKVQTMQHVNQFGRKLQRRITLRTIAEAKALRQQGVATVNCLKYLLELLARDPKEFMKKMREVWAELSKDEPENQLPPSNLEQLIAMLTREGARFLVHFINYTTARAAILGSHGLHVAHVAALHAIWWADYAIKQLNLEPAVEKMATQLAPLQTKVHGISVNLWVRLLELLQFARSKILKEKEGQSIANNDKPNNAQQPVITSAPQNALPAPATPPTATPATPPASTPSSTPTSTPSSSPTSSPNTPTANPSSTPSPKQSSQRNGDPYTNSESSPKVAY